MDAKELEAADTLPAPAEPMADAEQRVLIGRVDLSSYGMQVQL